MLQLMNKQSLTATNATSATDKAPPLTTKLLILAPRAEQLMKLQPNTETADSTEPGDSMANAPPLHLDADPVAPLSTETEMLLKVELFATT
jgi:hypothetical protein